jgi:Na+/H+ antiporter NhaD/arsenite permease-like protein
MNRIKEFVKKEAVLTVAIFLAVISMFFVHPDKEYIGYIDFRTLGILFMLMVVVAGFSKLGIFEKLAKLMLARVNRVSGVVFTLTILCFLSSMFITNDVALITFVPFAFTTFKLLDEDVKKKYMIPTVVFETVAANLGSMLTPVGNPQNLYLYGKAEIGIGEFTAITAPYTLMSFVLIALGLTVLIIRNGNARIKSEDEDLTSLNASQNTPRQGVFNVTLTELFMKSRTRYHVNLILYIMLFIVALLSVLRIFPWHMSFFITLIIVLFADHENLKNVDYSLLMTFVAFFIFIGNMGRIPAFSTFLSRMVSGKEVITAVLSSQVVSNVPAALLLSGFTDNYKALIIGTDLGGLGTLIASMASLISYKIAAQSKEIKMGKYLLYFTMVNVVFLIILFLFHIIIA